MSRFVAAGTESIEDRPDDAWDKAKRDVENRRQSSQANGKQDGGQSLFETLQQNKAAKQEAYEESIRLKNQFRPLDEDEVEYLDSIQEAERAKEVAFKRETAEQLETFRKQREAAEQANLESSLEHDSSTQADVSRNAWTTKKKRKRDQGPGREEETKLKKISSHEDSTNVDISPKLNLAPLTQTTMKANLLDDMPVIKEDRARTLSVSPPTIPSQKSASVGLGLGAYSSDED